MQRSIRSGNNKAQRNSNHSAQQSRRHFTDTDETVAYGSFAQPGAAPTRARYGDEQPTAPAPQAAAPPSSRSAAPPAKKAGPTQAEMVAGLDVRLARLTQVRDWISEDGDIARLIDSVIGRQVSASERRQARFGVILNVIFLLGGWALSLISTPAILGKLFNIH